GSGGPLGTRTCPPRALAPPRASRLRPGTSPPRRGADNVVRTPAPLLVARSAWEQESAGRARPRPSRRRSNERPDRGPPHGRRAAGHSKLTTVGSPTMLSVPTTAVFLPAPPSNVAAAPKSTSPIRARFSVLWPRPRSAVTSPSKVVVPRLGVRCLLLIDRKLF